MLSIPWDPRFSRTRYPCRRRASGRGLFRPIPSVSKMRLNAIIVAVLAASAPAYAQLNRLAVAAGLKYFGTAVDNPGLNNNAYMQVAKNKDEFGQVTPANGQKWDATERSQGSFSYASGDAVTSLVKQTGQILRCHTLVWYSQLPSWGRSPNGQTNRETPETN
jgi:endo-1,4-beta-xylanase